MIDSPSKACLLRLLKWRRFDDPLQPPSSARTQSIATLFSLSLILFGINLLDLFEIDHAYPSSVNLHPPHTSKTFDLCRLSTSILQSSGIISALSIHRIIIFNFINSLMQNTPP
ncbi:hypothetical protein HGRIS_008763 [Hohenbuehelia grisea]|uniref:Uncharacterized protein n=1 Tax=Hohenbuehelia grisea TaxID=104357 RepID=A0ABR3J9B9_9AGAR